MGDLAIETRSLEPKRFFAGDFQTLTDTGTAKEAISEYAPVTVDGDGGVRMITAETKDQVAGIAAAAAEKNAPAIYYLTGEFFADALAMPDGVKPEEIKGALRSLSIFLR